MLNKFLLLEKQQQKILLIVGVLLIIGLGLLLGGSFKNQVVQGEKAQDIVVEEKESKGEILVYISGAVEIPGVYTLEEGTRLIAALEQAKALENADLNALNLAQVLEDESKITVPYLKDAATENSGTKGTDEDGKININTADAKELELVPGIGPQMAQKILTYREEKGLFTKLEDLLNVSGIGEKTLEKFTPYIVL